SLHAEFWTSEPHITGPELRHLKGHKNLREIDITNMPISGEYFEVLTTLARLEILRCTPKEKAAEALKSIGKCKGLRVLTMSDARIDDGSLQTLRGLTNLEELNVSGSPVAAGAAVVLSMDRLRVLSLTRTNVDDEFLRSLNALKYLEKLFVSSPNITDSG